MNDWHEIPLASNTHHFIQDCPLFGRLYQLEFEWIEREYMWVFHVRDELEKPLSLGNRLMVEWPMMMNETDRKLVFLLRPIVPKTFLALKTLVSDFSLLVGYAPL